MSLWGLSFLSSPAPVDLALAYAELHRDLDEDKKKCRSRDCMLVRTWKAVRVMFVWIFPTKDLSKISIKDVEEFLFLNHVDEEGTDTTSLADNATS